MSMDTDARELAGPQSSWPDFSDLEPATASQNFPTLSAVRGRSIVQDRWERIVAEIEIPADLSVVWSALTTPEDVKQWLARCVGDLAKEGTDVTLDFEDGEFFYCRVLSASSPAADGVAELKYYWRWAGIGPATRVTWQLSATPGGTRVRATEEAFNPPSDWRAWNGNGWPGILDQLAGYLRTGRTSRWPWRRMGPYVQIELEAAPYDAWDVLCRTESLRYWLCRRTGTFTTGDTLELILGDASGVMEMTVHNHVEPNQAYPSFLPYVEYGLKRRSWQTELFGRIFIGPAGLNRSLLEIFVGNWENVPTGPNLEERRVVAGFFRDAAIRARDLTSPRPPASHPHGWS
jgi:uncharacterized protein YndB with AHSA1/START domain